jgi:Xaa-Pro aminopeptidase
MTILQPGLTFRKYAEQVWDIPAKRYANRYYYLSARGYDGVIVPGMANCLESYIGEEGDSRGVKIEQQVLITEDGIELQFMIPC